MKTIVPAQILLAAALAALPPAARAALCDDATPPPKESTESQQKQESKDQAKKKPAPPSAAPTTPPKAPLSFTDADLERFHKPAPAADEVPEEEPAAGTPAKQGLKPPANRVTRPAEKIAGQDPLQPFRDKEQKEKFRQEQVQRARERIGQIESRLAYLKSKKDALSNPAPILAGQTRIQNEPAAPGQPPPPPNPVKGPGKVAIGGFFPAIPPPQTDDDAQADKTLKVKDLIEQIDKEIKDKEAELETAKSELVSIETRFGQEAPGK